MSFVAVDVSVRRFRTICASREAMMRAGPAWSCGTLCFPNGREIPQRVRSGRHADGPVGANQRRDLPVLVTLISTPLIFRARRVDLHSQRPGLADERDPVVRR